jgi:hypothetical protein
MRNDNSSGPAYVGTGTGTTAPEQYTAISPSNPSSTTPIQPGQTTQLRSTQTGSYCRLVPLPSNSSQLGMLCDLPSPSGATVLTYMGSGLSTAEGVPLVATGPGAPLLLANTTAVPAGPNASQLSFPLAPSAGEGTARQREHCLWYVPLSTM